MYTLARDTLRSQQGGVMVGKWRQNCLLDKQQHEEECKVLSFPCFPSQQQKWFRPCTVTLHNVWLSAFSFNPYLPVERCQNFRWFPTRLLVWISGLQNLRPLVAINAHCLHTMASCCSGHHTVLFLLIILCDCCVIVQTSEFRRTVTEDETICFFISKVWW